MEAIRVLFKPEAEDLISIFGGYLILMIPAGIYLLFTDLDMEEAMSNGMLIVLVVVAIWFFLDGCDRWIYVLKKGLEGEYDESSP